MFDRSNDSDIVHLYYKSTMVIKQINNPENNFIIFYKYKNSLFSILHHIKEAFYFLFCNIINYFCLFFGT